MMALHTKKPIKIKRNYDHSNWIIPLLCLIFTLSASLVIAVAWQNMTTDSQEVQAVKEVFAADAPKPSVAKAISEQSAPEPVEVPPEPEEKSIADYYGAPLPESSRVTSEYFEDAVFIGDSLTTGFKVYDVMSGSTVMAATGVNLATVTTANIVDTQDGEKTTIPDALARSSFAKIYIMMGANGVGHFSNKQSVELYSDFIDQVRAISPDSIIYIQSILPICESKYKERYSASITNADIDELNNALLQMAGEKQCFYLDVASAFRDDNGHMPPESTPDGLHLYSAGYTTWFDYLKTHVYE